MRTFHSLHIFVQMKTLTLFLTALFFATLGLTTSALTQGAPTPLVPGGAGQQPYPQSQPPYQQPYPGQNTDPSQPYRGAPPAGGPPPYEEDTFSSDEILKAGHRFFGQVSTGLARVIEYAFSKSGRPNGYILGEEAGGAFVAGLRYGEGMLNTKDAGQHKIFWQGPSIGYDFGAEGSKTLMLVYNLRSVDEMYGRFGGIDGSAFFIGGVGLTFQKRDNVTLAPIRAGIGLRLGANVGYLKFTRQPTWNPF